jgi:hypothetical protein
MYVKAKLLRPKYPLAESINRSVCVYAYVYYTFATVSTVLHINGSSSYFVKSVIRDAGTILYYFMQAQSLPSA